MIIDIEGFKKETTEIDDSVLFSWNWSNVWITSPNLSTQDHTHCFVFGNNIFWGDLNLSDEIC